MNCEQAKKIDLVDYLQFLGYRPSKQSKGNDYYYLSPLRPEHDPSFHIDRDKNVWFDHGGDSSGGTIIDFGIQYHHCTISDFLKMLEDYAHSHQLPNIIEYPKSVPNSASDLEKRIEVLSVGPIVSPALLYYLKKRKINEALAQLFCCEVKYKLYGRIYYAIGFKNDRGGYELRNSKFKGSSKPKGITFIDRGFKTVEVIEGNFSFLSFLIITKDWQELQSNFLILNSLSFFTKCQEVMEKHDLIRLHLDRDLQGFLRTSKAKLKSSKYENASGPYMGYKDWNEYLIILLDSPHLLKTKKALCFIQPCIPVPFKVNVHYP